MYKRPVNARGEATLAVKLEHMVKRHMNVQLSHTAKLHSNESSCKALSAKLGSQRSYMKFEG